MSIVVPWWRWWTGVRTGGGGDGDGRVSVSVIGVRGLLTIDISKGEAAGYEALQRVPQKAGDSRNSLQVA